MSSARRLPDDGGLLVVQAITPSPARYSQGDKLLSIKQRSTLSPSNGTPPRGAASDSLPPISSPARGGRLPPVSKAKDAKSGSS